MQLPSSFWNSKVRYSLMNFWMCEMENIRKHRQHDHQNLTLRKFMCPPYISYISKYRRRHQSWDPRWNKYNCTTLHNIWVLVWQKSQRVCGDGRLVGCGHRSTGCMDGLLVNNDVPSYGPLSAWPWILESMNWNGSLEMWPVRASFPFLLWFSNILPNISKVW